MNAFFCGEVSEWLKLTFLTKESVCDVHVPYVRIVLSPCLKLVV